MSWVYIAIRNSKDYDQSLVDTIIILPIVVTSIIIIVQNSLALAFSIAGIAAAVRFRNSLKSSGDALFILLRGRDRPVRGDRRARAGDRDDRHVQLLFLLLWMTDYGDRAGSKKRYMADCGRASRKSRRRRCGGASAQA